MNKPNILLLVMDTARAQNVLDQGEVMPNLAQIAEEGTTFSNAFTTGPWTLPSHASMFTGQYTSDHGAHAGSKNFDPDVPTLAEELQRNGYQTVSFSNNTWISPEFGYDRGFEDFFVSWELFDRGADLAKVGRNYDTLVEQTRALSRELLSAEAPQTVLNALYAKFLRKRYDSGAFVTNWRIKRWLSKRRDRDRPFFAFVNYLEPHLEYDPPKNFWDQFVPDDLDQQFVEQVNQDAWKYIGGQIEMTDDDFRALKTLYKGELHYLDHRIGKLYDHLAETDLLNDTVLLVVGDHGENIGEHGLMDHQYCLYDTLLHVPMIARYPETFPPSSETDALIELRDIYPTILDLASIEGLDSSERSTRSIANVPKRHRNRVIGEYTAPQPSMEALRNRVGTVTDEIQRYDRGLRSIRTDKWKYIEGTDGSAELYAIRDDLSEIQNLADEHPKVVERMSDELESELGELSERTNSMDEEMDSGAKQRLEDLGYLQ